MMRERFSTLEEKIEAIPAVISWRQKELQAAYDMVDACNIPVHSRDMLTE
ncbi:MAG: hypothetical protein LBD43_01290 [Holosporales bacterium]|jgi:hypothetical protein|nr:hypothetical protein [Holosporales bacterium]